MIKQFGRIDGDEQSSVNQHQMEENKVLGYQEPVF